jgi:uncharacterized protein
MALRAALIAVAVLFSGCGGIFFQPSNRIDPRLDELKAPYEVVKFKSGDGTELKGLFLPAKKLPAKATVVQFHGNGENMTSHVLFCWWLLAEGYNVFSFDYRGYAGSQGSPSIKGAVADGIAALEYVKSRKDVDSGKLVVLGQSLGGAIAPASLVLGSTEGVRAVVLDSTFSSYRSIARRKLGGIWLTWPLQYPLSLLFPDSRSPRKNVGKLGVPLLMLHGDADDVVPLAEGRALFAAAREPKEFWEIPGGKHTDGLTVFHREIREKLLSWLDSKMGSDSNR